MPAIVKSEPAGAAQPGWQTTATRCCADCGPAGVDASVTRVRSGFRRTPAKEIEP